jgi:hypothetical protein
VEGTLDSTRSYFPPFQSRGPEATASIWLVKELPQRDLSMNENPEQLGARSHHRTWEQPGNNLLPNTVLNGELGRRERPERFS